MAQGTDAQIKSKYESNTEALKLLSKTRAEIAAMIPQSASANQDQNPVVLAVKEQLA